MQRNKDVKKQRNTERRYKMNKVRASVVVIKRGDSYYCDVTGQAGGGFRNAFAGKTPEEAALFAQMQKVRYIDNNPLGGDMFLPAEVKQALGASKA